MTWTAKRQHGNEQIDQQHIGCQRKEILQKTCLGFCEFESWVVNQPNIQWSRIKLAAKGKLHISALLPAFFLFCTQIIWYIRKKKLNTYFWETIQEFFPLCLWLWWLAWCVTCYRKTRYWRSGFSSVAQIFTDQCRFSAVPSRFTSPGQQSQKLRIGESRFKCLQK